MSASRTIRRRIVRRRIPEQPLARPVRVRVTITLVSGLDRIPHSFLIMPGQVQHLHIAGLVRGITIEDGMQISQVALPIEVTAAIS